MTEESPQAAGGNARRDALTPEQRKDIARKAADARWGAEVPQASHDGVVKIGNKEMYAAVLPNGKRLLSQGQFLQALGRSLDAQGRYGGVDCRRPPLLSGRRTA